MKFTLSWLEDHLATRAGLDEILGYMLQAGLEVEHVDNPAERLAPFTIAKVTAAEPHPDADRLRVCTVETVDGTKQIVCGAPNARAGMTAVYAPLGAYIPGLDFALDKKPRKIRGVESHGMLCSAKELEAGEDHDGIADLPDKWKLGEPAAKALGAGDPVIDFEVTPNRPDWLGVVGIARDLAAAGAGRFDPKEIKPISGGYDCPIEVKLEAPEACPVFGGVLIRGVKNGPSPDWLQARLKAIGLTPKSLLVDVTNYISYDRARPLHVYDADKLRGAVVARLGKKGETLLALDGKTYDLSEDMCVIGDDSGAIGLGGVMGGESTAVTDETVNVFIESAWFDPMRTARTGRATGIISDARYRFERGVDPASVMDGLAQAVQLITTETEGDVSHPVVAGDLVDPYRPEKATFKPADLKRLTGIELKPADMKRILKDLAFDVEDAGDAWYVRAPAHRFDIEQSADIVEELARLHGYQHLPQTSLPAPAGGVRASLTPMQQRVRTARRVLAGRGYLEAVTWSFMARADAALFAGGENALGTDLLVDNPVASDLDCMRPSMLANLAKAAQRASDRGEAEVRLFEAGPLYRGDGPKDQRTAVSGLVRPGAPRNWQGRANEVDAYAVKADVFAVLEAFDQPGSRFQIMAPNQDHWHPGQAASVRLGPKTTIAHFGALHPRVLRALDVDGPVYAFELNLNALPVMKVKALKTKPVLELADLTPIRRDLAFVVDEAVPAGDLVSAAGGADKSLIGSAEVFDVYRGPGVEEGKKSIAFEILIQPSGEALKDQDIDALMDKVVAAVAKKTGGVLRG
ncbi:MAG: phenylalanine--tRNA ligase subunit beta [Pseudomonadota bacterium]